MDPMWDESPQWIGFAMQQEIVDEHILAEVVKEVVATLRSRGVSYHQVVIEAYHCAYDLVKQSRVREERLPLAQVTMALQIFCLAVPASYRSPSVRETKANASSLESVSALPKIKEENVLEVSVPMSSGDAKRRSKRSHARRLPQKSEKEVGTSAPLARRTQLHTMPYKQYLQTDEWQTRRKNKVEQAEYRCQICFASNVRLDVHHRTYERRGYERDQDLVVLCEACHTLFHQHMQTIEPPKEEEIS